MINTLKAHSHVDVSFELIDVWFKVQTETMRTKTGINYTSSSIKQLLMDHYISASHRHPFYNFNEMRKMCSKYVQKSQKVCKQTELIIIYGTCNLRQQGITLVDTVYVRFLVIQKCDSSCGLNQRNKMHVPQCC